MARKPFDPEALFGPPPDPGPARRERARYGHEAGASELSVTDACDLIRQVLEERLPSPLRVVGEISNLNDRHHWYFSLKDEEAVLSCVVWASTAKKLKFTPQDGQQVVVSGAIGHYGPQGKTQMYVTGIKPRGEGTLDQRFRALCDKLRGQGYFDDSRKRPLPVFPRRIAVITSRSGAAIEDVMATARQRCPGVGFVLIDTRVQGAGAAEQIAQSIRAANREAERLGLDVILVTRGGGSLEDLWAFNERVVADATLASELPVVAAIGHESDTTIIELVADLRAATPTQAVMRIVPDREECHGQLVHLGHRLTSVLRQRLDHARLRELSRHLHHTLCDRLGRSRVHLETQLRTLEQSRPARVALMRRARLHLLMDRLRGAVRHRLDRRDEISQHRHRLRRAIGRSVASQHRSVLLTEQHLEAVSVKSVLHRGYSYTTLADGQLLRTIRNAGKGDTLVTHVADGQVQSIVGMARGKARLPQRNDQSQDGGQLDLFDASG